MELGPRYVDPCRSSCPPIFGIRRQSLRPPTTVKADVNGGWLWQYSLVKEGEWVIDDGGLMKLGEWQEVEAGSVRHGLMKLDDGGV
ncbi:hypothetical protein V6N12_063052 [Hibiscus sabdariffa]|uniref:Uncharacterized protein n=1 Tax=Hibiscus sabdariffa TaxID=183260 RepID=A0ABR2FAN4_9ROSI